MLRELHQAHPRSLVFLAPTSHHYSVHCGLFLAVSWLGMKWRKISGSKALEVCCSCGVSLKMGGPCSKTPSWMPWSSAWAACCIASVHHERSHAWGRLWQESRFRRCVTGTMALKLEHNTPKEARISSTVTPFCLHLTWEMHCMWDFANHLSESKARVSVGLGLKVRGAENLLSARKAQYWIRVSACRHSLWPQENWPTCQGLECSSDSEYCGTQHKVWEGEQGIAHNK